MFTDKKVSPKGQLNKEDLQKWGMNFLLFVAPTLVVFFSQLAMGVNWKIALPVALLAFYQSAADFFKKLNTGK